MALRIRPDGRVLCAAIHPSAPGDTYLDDDVHQRLSAGLKVLVTERFEDHMRNGEWWWRDAVPAGVKIDPFYLDR